MASVLASFVHRREEALAATAEALMHLRELAADRPDKFRHDLALVLSNHARMLGAAGWFEEALAASQEAVELLRELAVTWPDVVEPDLAVALNGLGNVLEDLGRSAAALQTFDEAVRTLLPHHRRLPSAFGDRMQVFAGNYLRVCERTGETADAVLLAEIFRRAGSRRSKTRRAA